MSSLVFESNADPAEMDEPQVLESVSLVALSPSVLAELQAEALAHTREMQKRGELIPASLPPMMSTHITSYSPTRSVCC